MRSLERRVILALAAVTVLLWAESIVSAGQKSNQNQTNDDQRDHSTLSAPSSELPPQTFGELLTTELELQPATTVSSDKLSAEPEPASDEATMAPTKGPAGDDKQVPRDLLPQNTSLFNRDAVDLSALGQMDCHLRNLDYCLAGMLGSFQRALPETSAELEVRCDEMRATTSCLALFNKRCHSFKVFAALVPFIQQQTSPLVRSSGLGTTKLESQVESLLMNRPARGRILTADLMSICEPEAKKSEANGELRKRIFEMAKCINSRVPRMSHCFEDLKTALQLFYEPTRSLPLRPSCCALSRFRHCSSEALDNVCGLSSFDQLIDSLGSQSGPFTMVRSIDRVCRLATDHRSAYCAEVLPPSGMKAPQRRGRKASKLAKALDLISFAQPDQEMLNGMGR